MQYGTRDTATTTGHRRVDSLTDHVSADMVGNHMPQHTAGMPIPDRAQIHITLTTSEIGDIGQPDRIQPSLVEAPCYPIRRKRRRWVRNRRADLERARADALDPDLGHDRRDGLLVHRLATIPQLAGDSRGSVRT
jgi:hypothetical protein